MKGKTLLDKIWASHRVIERPGHPVVLYVDLHLVHEATSLQAFEVLREHHLRVARPELTVATTDHVVPTVGGRALPLSESLVKQLQENCAEYGVELFGLDSPNQGIVHVIGPELGLTQPGMTVVCGDSHTSTHGALGALAFGIGTTEVAHVLATQCLLQGRPKTLNVQIEGRLGRGVSAKDVSLFILARWGVHVGRGHAIEYTGSAMRALSMEGRLTICNMSIELGARAGMIAPDEVTFEYLSARPYAPSGTYWEEAIRYWKSLPSDPDASYDAAIQVNAEAITPMITYGTTPGMGIPIDGRVPDPGQAFDLGEREAMLRALGYMDLRPGEPVLGRRIDAVFIGSCTNSRVEDLRAAASVLRGRKVNPSIRVLVVPGSRYVKRQAESEGLDRVFREAGAEWREPGCSMCVAVNGDELGPGQYAVSTSNRNFQGRQGKGARTFLASPLTAAASAVEGRVADPRRYLKTGSE